MKIAFLFITIDDVNFPQIWEYYFKNNYNKINIYCHPKNPQNVKTLWLKNNIIPNLAQTSWGHIIQAKQKLLIEALKDKNNQKFIFLTDSCIPIKSFSNLYKFLLNDDIKTSYIKQMPFKSYFIKKSNLEDTFKSMKLIKHISWSCLSRHHVKKLLYSNKLQKFFNLLAGDEYYLSILYPSSYIRNFMINNVNWKETHKKVDEFKKLLFDLYSKKEKENTSKYDDLIEINKEKLNKIRAHPKTYTNIDKDLNEITKMESFFARKFSKDSNIIEHYKKLF